jgi:type IV secretion system protein VirB6
MAYNATTQIFSHGRSVQGVGGVERGNHHCRRDAVGCLGLTIVLMVEGTFKLYGGDGEPLTDMLKKFAFWGLILSISSAAVGISATR